MTPHPETLVVRCIIFSHALCASVSGIGPYDQMPYMIGSHNCPGYAASKM